MNTASVYVTGHAQQRIKERCGVKSVRKIQHLCDNAYERGVRSENTKGKLKTWLDGKSREGSQISCYQEYAFVFSDKAELITILEIPGCIKKDMRKMILAA